MSPPNPIDKFSTLESSYSSFSGHGKTEISKVGHTASFIHMLIVLILTYMRLSCVKKRWLCLLHLQQIDTRRITHISAEQKRRFNIKLGFDTLHKLVTTLSSQPSIKVQYKDTQRCNRKRKSGGDAGFITVWNVNAAEHPIFLSTTTVILSMCAEFWGLLTCDNPHFCWHRSVKPPRCRRRLNTSVRCSRRELSCMRRLRDSERRSSTWTLPSSEIQIVFSHFQLKSTQNSCLSKHV